MEVKVRTTEGLTKYVLVNDSTFERLYGAGCTWESFHREIDRLFTGYITDDQMIARVHEIGSEFYNTKTN